MSDPYDPYEQPPERLRKPHTHTWTGAELFTAEDYAKPLPVEHPEDETTPDW